MAKKNYNFYSRAMRIGSCAGCKGNADWRSRRLINELRCRESAIRQRSRLHHRPMKPQWVKSDIIFLSVVRFSFCFLFFFCWKMRTERQKIHNSNAWCHIGGLNIEFFFLVTLLPNVIWWIHLWRFDVNFMIFWRIYDNKVQMWTSMRY